MPPGTGIRSIASRRRLRTTLGLAVVGALLAGLIVSGRRGAQLEVNLANRTGGTLTDVWIDRDDGSSEPVVGPSVAHGETLCLMIPLTERVVMRLRDHDRRPRRAEYTILPASGLRHDLTIVLLPPSPPGQALPAVGRKMTSRSRLVLGTSVEYEESLDQLDDPAASTR